MVRLVPVVVVVLLAVAAGMVLGLGPFESAPPEPTAEITSLEITDRGCQSDIREFSSSTNGANGSFVHAKTLDTGTASANVSAAIHRTSPDDAAIATYRVDLRTHTVPTDATCPQRIAYRLEYEATAGSVGTRTAVSLDGDVISCGGGTSGPDIGCQRLMDDEVHTHWSNGSGVTE